MARYVDGFLLAVPKKNLKAYTKMAKRAGKVWREYGALEYMECAIDDPNAHGMVPFSRAVKARPNETVFFSFAVYKSRKDRDRVMAKVMQDKRMQVDMKRMPFDMKRMAVGGFKAVVDL